MNNQELIFALLPHIAWWAANGGPSVLHLSGLEMAKFIETREQEQAVEWLAYYLGATLDYEQLEELRNLDPARYFEPSKGWQYEYSIAACFFSGMSARTSSEQFCIVHGWQPINDTSSHCWICQVELNEFRKDLEDAEEV